MMLYCEKSGTESSFLFVGMHGVQVVSVNVKTLKSKNAADDENTVTKIN